MKKEIDYIQVIFKDGRVKAFKKQILDTKIMKELERVKE